MGGSNRRWRRLSIGGGFASNGVAVVASSVAMVRWAVIMGMREREMKGGKERERERKKIRKTKKKQGSDRRKMVVISVVETTDSGMTDSDMKGEWERKREKWGENKGWVWGKRKEERKMENDERNRNKRKKIGKKRKSKWELLGGWEREEEEIKNK